MRKVIFNLILFFCLITVCGCSKNEKVMSMEELVGKINASAVMITAGPLHASGIVYSVTDKETVIISVAHLTDGLEQCMVTLAGNKLAFADVFFCDVESDISLLRIDNSLLDEEFVKNNIVACEPANEKTLVKGDTVYLAGSVYNPGSSVSKGSFGAYDYFVPEFNDFYTYLYCDSVEGMSGAGCFNEDGKLFGIVSAGSQTGETLCIPIERYIEIMEENEND